MLIAHRGFRTVIGEENRMVDFERALKITPSVEFDIRLTKDKKIIIFHDDDFDRIGQVDHQVRELTYETIKKIPFFATHPDFLPPLLIEDFAQKLAAKYQLINVEIKADEYSFEDLQLLEQALLKLRKKTQAQIIVSSFSRLVLHWIGDLGAEFKKGYLFERPKEIDLSIISEFDYLHPSFRAAKKRKSRKIFRMLNLPLIIWTLKKPEEVKKIQSLYQPTEIYGYISDNPNLKVD